MATIDLERITSPRNVEVIRWANMATGDDGEPAELAGVSTFLLCIQTTGTFGGASVALQGSNDNSNWFALKDPSGNAIAFTNNGGADFSTSARYVRVNITGGSGGDMTTTLVIRSQ